MTRAIKFWFGAVRELREMEADWWLFFFLLLAPVSFILCFWVSREEQKQKPVWRCRRCGVCFTDEEYNSYPCPLCREGK